MATRTKTAPAKKTAGKGKAALPELNKVQLPEGYAPVMNGEFGEEWDYENFPSLVGILTGATREVTTGKGRSEHTSRVINVASADDGVIYTVWESASLRGWFDTIARCGDGARVAVVFQGFRDVGKAAPMKVFIGSVHADDMPEAPASHPKRDARRAEAAAKRPAVKRALAKNAKAAAA
jgi:hypothetical protein